MQEGDGRHGEDRRREMGDNALTSKAGVRKLNFAFLEEKILAPFIMLRLGCSRSPLKEETLSHFLKTSKVSEVTHTVV